MPSITLEDFGFGAVVQILLITGVIYYIFSLFRGTRSAQILFGIITFAVALIVIARITHLDVLLFLAGKVPFVIGLVLLVIFQPEIRQAFLALGHRRFTIGNDDVKDNLIDIVSSTAIDLSSKRYGALIVIERNTHLSDIVRRAEPINAPIGLRLLSQIFVPNTPLHDGAVIIKGETILAARCNLPVSDTDVGRGFRHRAALGITEETDAVAIVVSEETGSISLSFNGRFITNLTKDSLSRYLNKLLRKESVKESIQRSLYDLETEIPENHAKHENSEEVNS